MLILNLKEAVAPKIFTDGRLAFVSYDDGFLKVAFDKDFTFSPRQKFQKNDFYSVPIATHQELTLFMKNSGVKTIPFEVHDEEKLRDVFNTIRGM